MKKLRKISLLLAFAIIINILNIPIVQGDNQNPNEIILKSYTDQEPLYSGKEGVNYDIDFIKMTINSNEANISKEKLNKIKIYTQGNIDETDKFDVSYSKGLLSVDLKYSNIQTYQLKKHTLYTVNIPQGIFQNKNTNKYNDNIYYSFTTKTDESDYPKDILKSTYPQNLAHSVDTKPYQIIFEFIDDIHIEPEKLKNIEDYITIESKPIYKGIPSYNTIFDGDDHISNYNVYIRGNKLVLESKRKPSKTLPNTP